MVLTAVYAQASHLGYPLGQYGPAPSVPRSFQDAGLLTQQPSYQEAPGSEEELHHSSCSQIRDQGKMPNRNASHPPLLLACDLLGSTLNLAFLLPAHHANPNPNPTSSPWDFSRCWESGRGLTMTSLFLDCALWFSKYFFTDDLTPKQHGRFSHKHKCFSISTVRYCP